MLDFVLNVWVGFFVECNVLWSDDHNDIGLVVSLWGLTFSLNQLSILILLSL
jgi:hypothetical protein